MLVTENPAAAERLIRQAHDERVLRHPRPDGIHVSHLVYCLRKSHHTLRHGELPVDLRTMTMFLTGHGHHALLEGQRPEVGLVEEVEGEPVHGTLDMLVVEPRMPEFPGEIKTTRASSQKPLEQSLWYVDQLATYCLMKRVNFGRLYILHLNGDAKKARQPELKAWDIWFSDEELERWRREITRRVRLLRADEEPPLDEHYKWECGYCPLRRDRGGPCPGSDGRQPFWLNESTPEWVTGVANT